MNCKDFHKDIIKYPEGSLSSGRIAELEKHAQGCSDCMNKMITVRKIDTIIEKDIIREENPWFYAKVKAKLENEVSFSWNQVFNLRPVYMAAAVIFPLIVGFLLIFGSYQRSAGIDQNNSEYYSNSYLLSEQNESDMISGLYLNNN